MNKTTGAGRFRLAWILVAIGALNGLFWTAYRWNYENHYTQAQLTVDYDDTKTMADAYGIPESVFLAKLKDKGISSLGLYDLTLNAFRDNGRIAITSVEEATRMYPDAHLDTFLAPPLMRSYHFLISATPSNQGLLLNQILPHLQAQSQTTKPWMPLTIALGPNSTGILLPRSQELFGDALMGFDPAEIQAAQTAGLSVTARVSNTLNFDYDRLEALFSDIVPTKAKVVIFSEDEVVGYDSLYKVVAQEMQKRNLLFGNIEFTKQRGWEDFANVTNGNLVRVHSVSGDEAAKAKTEMLVDRFARAIKERDIRVAYIRLVRQLKGEVSEKPVNPLTGESDAQDNTPAVQLKSPLQQNLDFIGEIDTELKAQPVPAFLRPAIKTGQAQAFGDYPLINLERQLGSARAANIARYLSAFLAGLGAVGGTLLLLNLFFDLSASAQRNWLLAGLMIVAVMAKSPSMGAKLMALEAGSIFSVIGILWGGLPQLWDRARRGDRSEKPASPGLATVQGTVVLLKSTAITFIGPLLIVALLNQWRFFSGTDKYLLPKITQLFPLLVVGLAFAGEVFPHRVVVEGAAVARRRARDRFMGVLNTPFTIRIALVLLVVGIAGMIWIARTGNDSGMEISPFELHFRAILERVFITRPRTKEIFMGMPAMLFAAYFILRRQNMAAFGAIILGTIGQADLLNTFCHIHTPFFYSLLRSIHGVWLGALLGAIALYIYVWFERRALALVGTDGGPGASGRSVPIIPPPVSPPTPVAPLPVVVASDSPEADVAARSLFYHDEDGRLRRR